LRQLYQFNSGTGLGSNLGASQDAAQSRSFLDLLFSCAPLQKDGQFRLARAAQSSCRMRGTQFRAQSTVKRARFAVALPPPTPRPARLARRMTVGPANE
jgi:hypothetical protein